MTVNPLVMLCSNDLLDRVRVVMVHRAIPCGHLHANPVKHEDSIKRGDYWVKRGYIDFVELDGQPACEDNADAPLHVAASAIVCRSHVF